MHYDIDEVIHVTAFVTPVTRLWLGRRINTNQYKYSFFHRTQWNWLPKTLVDSETVDFLKHIWSNSNIHPSGISHINIYTPGRASANLSIHIQIRLRFSWSSVRQKHIISYSNYLYIVYISFLVIIRTA